MSKKRIVIDWIRNICRCDVCGNERYGFDGFWITNAQKKENCITCGNITEHTIVAHEVSLLEEIQDIE